MRGLKPVNEYLLGALVALPFVIMFAIAYLEGV